MTTDVAAHLPAGMNRSVLESVVSELDWATGVDESELTVSFAAGVVTVIGAVAEEPDHDRVLAAVLRAPGTFTIDDQVLVGVVPSTIHCDDPANSLIATRVEAALGATSIPRRSLRAEVRDHGVILSGAVSWGYEREAARHAVESVMGVRSVENGLGLVRRPSADNTMSLIRRELGAHSHLSTGAIQIGIREGEVTLSGVVETEQDSRRAEHAAWTSPHVTDVFNSLTVSGR